MSAAATSGRRLRDAAEAVLGGTPARIEKRNQLLKVYAGDELVAIVEPVGSAVMIQTKDWLEARPRSSAKLTHVAGERPGWVACVTESEWHVRGIMARAVVKIEARGVVAERLAAHLVGAIRSIPIGPESPEFWKALAHWGRETELISSSDRRFAFMYGERLERRIPVSEAYARWAERKSTEALRLGFNPPVRDVIPDLHSNELR
jgi:hypothetical protein